MISGYGAMLCSALKDDPAARDMSNEVVSAAQKAAQLTRQLLVFSRNQAIQLTPVDLNETLLQSLAMLGRLIGEDITIETHLEPGLSFVHSDAGQLSQVLMNLAANARDAMPNGGKIIIRSEHWEIGTGFANQQLEFAPGRYVRLLFSDTGQGMDAETQSRIFEPFFTTKEFGKGTGLGLATVYGIVKLCGGQIMVYSEPGQGTTFSIYLPCVEGDCQLLPGMESSGGTEGCQTILLVEDESSIRKLALSILRPKGYRVIEAANADAAIEQVQSYAGAIQLMLTDIVMPGKNGQVLAIQAATTRPEMRIIFMSGYTEHATLEQILSNPRATFLQKPFTPDQLLKKVRSVLD